MFPARKLGFCSILFGAMLLMFVCSSCKQRNYNASSSTNSTVNLPANGWYADNREIDSDGDGRSDWMEKFKYNTNPAQAETFAHPERDKTYTVKVRLEVLKPINLEAMNNDHQNALLVSETEHTATVDVTVYPLAKSTKGLEPNKNWREYAKTMQRWITPGLTTNWNAELRDDVLANLNKRGVDTANIDDITLVKAIAAWLTDASAFPFKDFFISYDVLFQNGNVLPNPKLKQFIEREMQKFGYTDLPKSIALGILGNEMYKSRYLGNCTAAATLFATVLKAVGIPTRFVLSVPVIDGNDLQQRQLLENGITNHDLRTRVLLGQPSQGFAAHTFNEVFVGGRWVRLNYSNFAQGAVWTKMGLLVEVNSFADWADAENHRTWGEYALQDFFRPSSKVKLSSQNPYRAITIQDEFGVSSGLPNPEIPLLKEVKVKRFVTASSPGIPSNFVPFVKGNLIIDFGIDDHGVNLNTAITQFIFSIKKGRVTLLGNDGSKNEVTFFIQTMVDTEGWTLPDGLTIPLASLKPGVRYHMESIDDGGEYKLLVPPTLDFEVTARDF